MQYSKVEISSVNTASLKVLSEQENRDCLKAAAAGDKEARERLITGNLRLVLSIVQRFRSRDENADDLFQVGCIGLIKACDRFDVSLDLKFSTYAVPMIIGELRRYLRDSTPIRVSRSMRDTAYHAMQMKEELIRETDTEPTAGLIAKRMGLPERQVVAALESIVEPISLYEPVFSENGDAIYVVDQLGGDDSEADWIEEISLKEEIGKLDPREKLILHKRFMEGRTQTEVAKEIGISQAQISRLEKEALKKIKS
ncbi:MAG: SigB/SigF/SigG family RNA polymerase sigma factor [Clostridia bacterium]|nr:SigB/SigF/SigG family RNA polymerase sigma factor [Clostridia bacterium]